MTKPLVQSAAEFRRAQGLPVKADQPWWWDATGVANEQTVCQEIRQALWFYGFDEPSSPSGSPNYFLFTQQRDARKAGSSRGVPDLLVMLGGLPFALCFEVKKRNARKGGGKLSPEQQVLADAGCVYVVRSWREVIERINAAKWFFSGEVKAAFVAAMGRKPCQPPSA